MKARMDYAAASPAALQAMLKLESFSGKSGIEPSLRELIKVRASLINECAYCVDMHWKDARAAGETEQRLYGVATWEEAPYFTERERAALAWTDALTRIADTHAPDDVYEYVRQHFDEESLMNLTVLICTINSWNRIAIGFRSEAGSYTPAAH